MINCIDAKTLRSWQLGQRDFVLVDTLPLSSYEKSHLPNAISIVSDDIIELAPLRLPDKNAMIVVYCASKACKRAVLAAERLETLGYESRGQVLNESRGQVLNIESLVLPPLINVQ